MSRDDRIRALGVVVPAHDEEQTVAACLDAIRAARAHLQRTVPDPPGVRVVVVLDACTDGTASIVATADDVEIVSAPLRRVGAARAAGVSHVLRHCATATPELWLANTDADSEVPVDWLSTMVRAARAGAHLVLGTTIPSGSTAHPLPRVLSRAWHAEHRLRDGHPHVHGANLGIRADAYLALGGWTAIASGEDVSLAQRARDAGHLRVVRTAAIPVRTSARTAGRAPAGFAAYLQDLAAATGTAS